MPLWASGPAMQDRTFLDSGMGAQGPGEQVQALGVVFGRAALTRGLNGASPSREGRQVGTACGLEIYLPPSGMGPAQ
jgi:hypothetical protein